MTSYIEVEIDEIAVEVDEAEWATDQEAVIARVRADRAEQRLEPLDEDDYEPSYTDLYGEDG